MRAVTVSELICGADAEDQRSRAVRSLVFYYRSVWWFVDMMLL